MRLDEVREFREKLKSKIYPEISLHLFVNNTELLANNLGETVQNVIKVCKYNRKYSEGYIKRLIQGRISKNSLFYDEVWVSNFWHALFKLNKNQTLIPALKRPLITNKGSQSLYEKLYCCTESTPTGRIRSKLSILQRNNYSFCGLAADGAKLALWNLIHSGFRVIAFVHDEFVIEIPENEENHYDIEVKLVNSIVCESMQYVVPNVPISTKHYISRSWSIEDKII